MNRRAYLLVLLLLAGLACICSVSYLLGWLVPVRPAVSGASAIIQNESVWYPCPTCELHIFGEVNNTGDVWLTHVRVTGTLLDKDNSTVDVYTSNTYVAHVPPGGVAAFDIWETDTDKAARVHGYSLRMHFQVGQAVPRMLEIMNVTSFINEDGIFEVSGDVKNKGTKISEFTQIYGTFYDTDGKVIYSALTAVRPHGDVPPGRSRWFQLVVPDSERSSKVKRFALVAEGTEYSSIPEMPWPTLLTALTITFTMAALKKSMREDQLAR